LISDGEVFIRLVLSAVAGGVVGIEREANHSSAGLRTHILVTIGSALIMLISMYGFQGLGTDNSGGEPARLAAQVVSGIGFLGAGTILRNGNNIRGLTTAASIWVCGGIGLAIGNGYYLGGLATTLIVLFALRGLGFVQKKVIKTQDKLLIVQCKERAGLIGDIGQILGVHNINIRDIKVNGADNIEEDEENLIEIKFTVKLPAKPVNESFLDDVLKVHGVECAIWKGDLDKVF
jgi:putative Mg2+ transporter-C (MgtC) family protein